MSSIDQLVHDLRRFDGRREVVKALRTEIRKPIPDVRRAIRKAAMDRLPSRGGFGAWAAKTRVTAKVTTSGRSAGVRLKGARGNLAGTGADLSAIDRGRARHPSWGRRAPSQWHVQAVSSGYFTAPASDATVWQAACVAAVDKALATIAGR